MSSMAANRVMRVFYRDYANAVSISSAQPESLLAGRIGPLADRLLCSADNFLGVVDRNDVIVQCYLADDQVRVVLELVYPEASGCLRLVLPRDEALRRLGTLPEQFDEHTLEGAQYID